MNKKFVDNFIPEGIFIPEDIRRHLSTNQRIFFIPEDKEANLLANGEKILIISYDHPAPTACDCFSSLIRGEVDCSLATYTWLENLDKENPYKIYPYSDMDDFHVEDYDKGATSGTGSPNYLFDDEALANIENMMES